MNLSDQISQKLLDRELFQIRVAILALPPSLDAFAVVNAAAGRLLHRAIELAFTGAGLEFHSHCAPVGLLFPYFAEWFVNDRGAASRLILEEIRFINLQHHAVVAYFDTAERIFRPIYSFDPEVDLQNLDRLLLEGLKACLQESKQLIPPESRPPAS